MRMVKTATDFDWRGNRLDHTMSELIISCLHVPSHYSTHVHYLPRLCVSWLLKPSSLSASTLLSYRAEFIAGAQQKPKAINFKNIKRPCTPSSVKDCSRETAMNSVFLQKHLAVVI